jgi:predicted ArsR family transcriptional regulator
MNLDDNSTRSNIIQLLKKSNGLSIDELSKNINITPMGIRQHLLALEKKGIVSYTAHKNGIGRPGFVYILTNQADTLFSTSYDKFAIEILNDIKKFEGTEKLDMIFQWRKEKQLSNIKDALSGMETFADIVTGLKNVLESEGLIVELTRNNGNYHLKQFNCPIKKIAAHFKDLCTYELQLYQELLGNQVTREQNIAEGSSACFYKIPAH